MKYTETCSIFDVGLGLPAYLVLLSQNPISACVSAAMKTGVEVGGKAASAKFVELRHRYKLMKEHGKKAKARTNILAIQDLSVAEAEIMDDVDFETLFIETMKPIKYKMAVSIL